MKVIQIVASVAEASHGPSYSAPRLAEGLAHAGAEVSLYTVGKPSDAVVNGVRRRVFRHDLGFIPRISHLRLSGAMAMALRKDAARGAEVLHSHGLWLAPNVFPANIAAQTRRKFVLSPRGMLGAEAMKFSGRQKKLFWLLAQGAAVRRAAFLHATGENEFEEIRAMGLKNPVVVLPNGIDVPPPFRKLKSQERIALSLGRVHPKKGLDRLVRGWARAGDATNGWRLVIVGPSEMGHADELRALVRTLKLSNVEIEGPLFDEQKLAAYRAAHLFVLPTLNENFAMTVAESLAAGTPVISTKGAPWAGLEPNRCGWWIDHGDEPMAAALKRVLPTAPADLEAMGERGRTWMQRDFSWDHIGERMLAAYDWAVNGGEPPVEARL